MVVPFAGTVMVGPVDDGTVKMFPDERMYSLGSRVMVLEDPCLRVTPVSLKLFGKSSRTSTMFAFALVLFRMVSLYIKDCNGITSVTFALFVIEKSLSVFFSIVQDE